MKATLEFNLNEAEDVMAHLRCVKSLDMAIALFEIRHNLIHRLQDLQELDTSGTLDLISILSEELQMIYRENGIDTERLVN